MGEGLGTLVSPALSLPRHKKPSVAEVPAGEAAGTHSQAVRVGGGKLCPALGVSSTDHIPWHSPGLESLSPCRRLLLQHSPARSSPFPPLFPLQGHPTPHPQQQKLFQPLPHTQHQQQPQELE